MKTSGILLVDKPVGMSSAAVVAKIKKKFKLNCIGHGGTLDPFASGLLVILIEEATKVSRFLLEGNKSYIAKASIGTETNTGDNTGEVTLESEFRPSQRDWEKSRSHFLGKILQTPPMFSALKQNGIALYKLARAGKIVEREPREVFIENLSIRNITNNSLEFEVACGGGTYIRSLAQDWAKSAGSAAHLCELRRTSSLGFQIKDAYTLEDILSKNCLDEVPMLSLASALPHLPTLECAPENMRFIKNGNLAPLGLAKPSQDGFFYLQSQSIPLAILSYQSAWKIERVFAH